MNKLKKIVNKISHLKSVFTPADKYNELVDILNESNNLILFLRNYAISYMSALSYSGIIVTQTGILSKKGYLPVGSYHNCKLDLLIRYTIKNDTNTLDTVTINQSVAEFIALLSNIKSGYENDTIIYTQESADSFIGATFNILLDNTIATTTNTLTLNLGTNTGLTVNGADSLVVSAGNVGKFEVVITSATTAKICRVY